MQITEALIQKFFNDECTASEAIKVSAYLQQNPEVARKYFEKSWNETGSDSPLPGNYSEEILDYIKTAVFKKKHFITYRTIRISAAASVLLVAGVWIWKATGRKAKQNTTVAAAKPIEDSWTIISNTTGKPHKAVLDDSTKTILYPHTIIKYRKHFNQDKRDVYLTGKAYFDVARDKNRPFTLHSSLFTTRALGTAFLVDEKETYGQVKLYSGKVMVKAAGANSLQWKDSVYLRPFEQVHYTVAGEQAVVSFFGKETQPAAPVNDNIGNPVNSQADQLVFDNTPLKDVMEKLEEIYQQSIQYNQKELSAMYFTGLVHKGDSLSLILNIIGNMNGLQVTRQAYGFSVKKSL